MFEAKRVAFLATLAGESPPAAAGRWFWVHDGVKGLGTPPRLYNQVARAVCEAEATPLTETEIGGAAGADARGDDRRRRRRVAGKDLYNVWRPVVCIRAHLPIPGRPDAPQDAAWAPLGAPNSNAGGKDFTPPFPAYPSGHATFARPPSPCCGASCASTAAAAAATR